MSLPPLLATIAASCGDDVALRIGERLGGTDIRILATLTERHPLRQILGQDIADTVAATLGPGDHYIPGLTRYYAAARAARIRAAAKTQTAAEIARAEGVTPRRVKQICEAR